MQQNNVNHRRLFPYQNSKFYYVQGNYEEFDKV